MPFHAEPTEGYSQAPRGGHRTSRMSSRVSWDCVSV